MAFHAKVPRKVCSDIRTQEKTRNFLSWKTKDPYTRKVEIYQKKALPRKERKKDAEKEKAADKKKEKETKKKKKAKDEASKKKKKDEKEEEEKKKKKKAKETKIETPSEVRATIAISSSMEEACADGTQPCIPR